jgi:hypothetical protein
MVWRRRTEKSKDTGRKENNVLWDRMFGMKIEGGRESRDEGAKLAQILTVSKGIGKKAWQGGDGEGSTGRNKMRPNEAAGSSFGPAQARGISTWGLVKQEKNE